MIEKGQIELKVELQQLLSAEQAWRYGIIPKANDKSCLEVYASKEHWSDTYQDELEMVIGKQIKVSFENEELIKESLSRYYRKKQKTQATDTLSFDVAKADDFVHQLITEANDIGGSDIHIETYEERCRVRIRIDGKLIEKYVIEATEYPALINKLKIKANLDIAEKRLPQDGRISFNTGSEQFDIRVSVLPTLHGEKMVMRLLSRDATAVDINVLGFADKQLQAYLEGVKKPYGIVLISGPTGSGKTTTLYATLKELNSNTTNIVTVEDPIEYTLEGINQVQLKEDIGLGFAETLRSFLRQDPDIIMLGEIRDGETAQMAIRAALTGHLVLSTIHTNSAWGTVSRLVDMGVPSYLLASTLNVSVAQRLVRLLCPECKKEEDFDSQLLPNGFKPPFSIQKQYKAVGCEHCHYTGYKGRKAVYEVIPIDYEMAEMVKRQDFDVNEKLKEKQISRLMNNAYNLLVGGETSVEEVYSILMSSY